LLIVNVSFSRKAKGISAKVDAPLCPGGNNSFHRAEKDQSSKGDTRRYCEQAKPLKPNQRPQTAQCNCERDTRALPSSLSLPAKIFGHEA
jgi:hypothetical protein